MKQERIGAFYLIAGFALAGTATTAGKALSTSLGPFSITAASLVFALPVLLPFLARGGRIRARELGTTAALGFFGILLYRLCLVSSLRLIGAGEAGLLTGAAPAFTVLVSWFALREKPSSLALIGAAIASAGIILVNIGMQRAAGPGTQASASTGSGALGAALALAAAASEAVFATVSRAGSLSDATPLPEAPQPEAPQHESVQYAAARSATNVKDQMDPLRRTALTVAWALGFSLFPALAERPAKSFSELGASGWFALAWYGLAVTSVSYFCWYQGIKRLPAARAAAFTGIVPVVSLALPAIALGERPTTAAVIGCALVAAGILAGSGIRPGTAAKNRPPRRGRRRLRAA